MEKSPRKRHNIIYNYTSMGYNYGCDDVGLFLFKPQQFEKLSVAALSFFFYPSKPETSSFNQSNVLNLHLRPPNLRAERLPIAIWLVLVGNS